jgi:hypothetical protein
MTMNTGGLNNHKWIKSSRPEMKEIIDRLSRKPGPLRFDGAIRSFLPLAIALLTATANLLQADWPMLGRDALRSGSTPAEIRPPFERKWYRLFADEGLKSGVQPIIVNGTVYLGTMAGKLYAIDAETGADIWVYQAGGPILHTAAAADGKVFFGSADGKIYALQTATGELAWSVSTGAAIWNAPAVHEKAVYIGSRDGRLYAIDSTNGEIVWSAPTGAPILNSPAIDPDRGRVYVGSENMRVFAFERATGKEVWRSEQLPGVSLRGFHPVVAPDGAVMVTVMPGVSLSEFQSLLYHDLAREVFALDHLQLWRYSKEEQEKVKEKVFSALQNGGAYQRQLDFIRARLEAEPAYQTFFVLDPEDGRRKFIPPVVYSESMNGPGAPPIVTPDGKVILKYQVMLRSRYGHYSPFLNVGYLDTESGHITPVMDQSRAYGWYDSLRMVHDEQAQLVVAGSLLLNTAQDIVSALDLKTLAGYPHPFCRNIHEPEKGEAVGLWQMLLRGEPLPIGKEWLARGTAVYGGGSVISAAVSVSGESLYYIPTHEMSAGAALIAYRMSPTGAAHEKNPPVTPSLNAQEWKQIQEMPWDWDLVQSGRVRRFVQEFLPEAVPGSRERPLSKESRARLRKITDQELDRFVWEIPGKERGEANREQTRDIQARLGKQIQELISKEWRPLLFPAATHPVEAYRLFVDPSETLYTLARAYPHLDARAREKVRSFVERQSAPGKPLAGLIQPAYSAQAGEARTEYAPPPEHLLRIRNDITRNAMARLYPLWLWAHVSEDWRGIEAHWTGIKPLIEQGPNSFEEDGWNGHMGGLIAYCRIARHMNDEEAVEEGLEKLREKLRERLEYEWAHPRGGVITFVPQLRSIFGRWRHLTPEVGRFLAAYTQEIHRDLMEVYVDYHRPTWWLAWNVELMWRNESPLSFPTMAQEIFAARALILDEPSRHLAPCLDLPWCRGDEFYIQKLVLCLEN